jgi:trans-aconitate methyltransferase
MSLETFYTLELWHFGLDLLLGSLVVGSAIGLLGGVMTFFALGRSLRDPVFTGLVKEASDRYLASGVTAWEFARGKLRNDPAYRQVVTGGLLPVRGHLLDVGCGQGLLLALIAAARRAGRAGTWPAEWPPAPTDLELTGVELRPRIARIAADTLGSDAAIHTADVRTLTPASANIIALFDILHLMSADDQERLLTALTSSLNPGGALLVREADAAGGWRFHAVRIGNRITALATRRWRTRFHFRTTADWHALLERQGLQVQEVRPAGEGTPFANILLVARKGP